MSLTVSLSMSSNIPIRNGWLRVELSYGVHPFILEQAESGEYPRR
jgi:hypothetical protein